MYKLVVFAALLAVALSAPSGPAVVTYAAAPIAAAPIAYAAHVVPAPVAIPAPVAYHTGYHVSYEVEPVEQHGYSIKY